MTRTDDTYLKQLQARYRKARKNEKIRILDGSVATTGYHRKHATAVLNGRREQMRDVLAQGSHPSGCLRILQSPLRLRVVPMMETVQCRAVDETFLHRGLNGGAFSGDDDDLISGLLAVIMVA